LVGVDVEHFCDLGYIVYFFEDFDEVDFFAGLQGLSHFGVLEDVGEDFGDSHCDHRKTELKGIEVVVEDEGVLDLFEGFDSDVFSLNGLGGTVRTATAPLFL